MPLMEWNESLDIHVDPMNDQHKVILNLINKIFDMNEQNQSMNDIIKVVNELGAYTVKHFKQEEEYMESIQYPQLEVHKGVHKNMLERFGKHVSEIEDTQLVSEDFLRFLKSWLTAHIRTTDMKYGNHANKTSQAS